MTTREDARAVITDIWLAEYKKYGYGRYALVAKQTGQVIGFCGLKYMLPDPLITICPWLVLLSW